MSFFHHYNQKPADLCMTIDHTASEFRIFRLLRGPDKKIVQFIALLIPRAPHHGALM